MHTEQAMGLFLLLMMAFAVAIAVAFSRQDAEREQAEDPSTRAAEQGPVRPPKGSTSSPPPQGTLAVGDPWLVLGIKPGASVEEIRAAYKRRCLEYHPDRVQHLGERLRAVAEDEMRRINAAYSTLVRS
jgi:DnaJ-domain-containing protein 1